MSGASHHPPGTNRPPAGDGRSALAPLKRDDLIMVKWVDITTDSTGDPADADLSVWESIGYFLGVVKKSGTPAIVISASKAPRPIDKDLLRQRGWLTIPVACIRAITRLSMGRTLKSLSQNEDD